jgi:hypothetical protein
MPDLKTLLASYDLAFLRDIAELWGIELQAGRTPYRSGGTR